MCPASARTAATQRGSGVILIPQDPRSAMDPLFRVGFQIEESLFCTGDGRRPRDNDHRAGLRSRLFDLLQRTGIGDTRRRLEQYPHQWSRGMLQRALLVAAFAVGPRLLVLDEVTSALDPTIALAILSLIRERVDKHGTSVLFITHDLDQARFLCDRMVVLHDGRIVTEGALDETYTHPGATATRPSETVIHPNHAPVGCRTEAR
jgi:ABC-type dipeptide/oligopeptide/nickel transport system ATPase component